MADVGLILLLTVIGFAIIIADLLFIPGGLLVVIGTGMVLYSVYLNFDNFGIISAILHMGACLAVVPRLVSWSVGRVALKSELSAEDGFVGTEDHTRFIDKEGVARSDLRPSGSVIVVQEGEEHHLDCIAEGGYIEKGERVVITAERGPSLIVRKVL